MHLHNRPSPVARRPSITIVTSAPVAENAFAPVDVTASVEVPAFASTGTAALMLDDTEIATTALQASTDSATFLPSSQPT